MIRVALVLFSVIAAVYGYGSGAPVGVCTTFIPSHVGIVAQTSISPYEFTADKSAVKNGETVLVTVSGTGFAGFFVAGVKDDSIVGLFNTPDDSTGAKIGLCTDTQGTDTDKTGVTHATPASKNSLEFTWNAPAAPFTGRVCFKGTIAQTKQTYWGPMMGACVDVSADGPVTTAAAAAAATTATTAAEAATTMAGAAEATTATTAATTMAGATGATTATTGTSTQSAVSIISSSLLITLGALLSSFY